MKHISYFFKPYTDKLKNHLSEKECETDLCHSELQDKKFLNESQETHGCVDE